jgi:nucleoside phosphorylase
MPSPRPSSTAASARALARHIILFDSDKPSTWGPHTLPLAGVMAAAARSPIPWPAGQAPTPAPMHPAPAPASPLPACDYLVVTWTVEEGKSLADTLTPNYPSESAWYHYTHNYASEYVPLLRAGAPALESKRLGSYFVTTIAGKRVLCFKSELHLSQDGPKVPISKLWAQLIAEARPKLVITTGTAGGIGASIVLGDVVVAPSVRFDCTEAFKSEPWHNAIYSCSTLSTQSFAAAQKLFAANANHLPTASRPPRIITTPLAGAATADVVTTDFFAFDDTKDSYGLQQLGSAVEMGDAVLGLVISGMASAAPKWVAVRNASDPEIDSTGLTLEEEATKASQIYERFGYWTTICSAITCWSLIVDN